MWINSSFRAIRCNHIRTPGHYHKLSGHSGRQHVLSLVRQRYWVVKEIPQSEMFLQILTNVAGRKQWAKNGPSTWGSFNPINPPFTTVRVNYFGPFQVRRSRGLVKRYVSLFTCLTEQCIPRLPITSTPTRYLHSGGLSPAWAKFEKWGQIMGPILSAESMSY